LPTLSPKRIFAANVRRLRLSAGLSQEALADRAGLHRTYISSIERGERNVALENIVGIAKALGVEPRDLLAPDPKTGGK
jgi:transcriptional regulator with XRE-family HTH domain